MNDLPSGPQLWGGDTSRWLGRKGFPGASLGAPCSPACPPGMSHGSAEQCVEGRAGAGAKMSVKSRMEDCGGERQPWLRGGQGLEEGWALNCHPHSSSFSPLFIPQTSINHPSPLHSAFQFIKYFLIH